MIERLNALRVAVCGAICLLALASLPLAHATAQGCDDCREIKGLPVATPRPARPSAVPSPAATVVRAVLYWAEGCGHCHAVLDGILPQMQQKHGAQFEARLVEVITLEDITAFYDVAEGFGFARGRAAVPFLLIGDHALMGVEQIGRELPGLIETYRAAGGVDWPILDAKRAAPQPTAATTAASGCDFATPCADGSAASTAASHLSWMRALSAPASILAALGLVAVSGGGLAVFLRQRASRRRAHAAAPCADTSLPANGDTDAT